PALSRKCSPHRPSDETKAAPLGRRLLCVSRSNAVNAGRPSGRMRASAGSLLLPGDRQAAEPLPAGRCSGSVATCCQHVTGGAELAGLAPLWPDVAVGDALAHCVEHAQDRDDTAQVPLGIELVSRLVVALAAVVGSDGQAVLDTLLDVVETALGIQCGHAGL